MVPYPSQANGQPSQQSLLPAGPTDPPLSQQSSSHGSAQITQPTSNPTVRPQNLSKPDSTSASLIPFAVNTGWVAFGIVCMVIGIVIVHQFLLPKIYACPAGATCHHNIDPRTTNIQYLQSLMQYWFKAGLWLAGLGLTTLISYSTRFVLERQQPCDRGSVDTSFLALQGSWSGALRQLTLRGTTWLGVLSLLQLAIGLIVTLVISSSIDVRGTINVHVPFKYPDSFSLPPLDSRIFTNEELAIVYQLSAWLSSPSRSLYPRTIFNGTLVNRDNRTIRATSPLPTGFHITGDLVACGPQGWNVSTLSTNSSYFSDGHGGDLTGVTAYNFSNAEFSFFFVTYSYTTLASQFLTRYQMDGSTTSRQYLWASNSSTAIPNATASHDDGIYYAVCNHTSYMTSLPTTGGSADGQIILPSQPIIYSNSDDPNTSICPSNDPFACVSWTVDDVVLAWWQLYVNVNDLIPFSCVNGLLAAFGSQSDTTTCSLTQERWENTLSTALDSLISAAPTSGNATQYLWASTEGINLRRWWIQGILPALILTLYLLCAAYNWHLSHGPGGREKSKEFDYVELLNEKGLVAYPYNTES